MNELQRTSAIVSHPELINDRSRVDTIKNTYLKPSHHHTETTTVVRPTQNVTTSSDIPLTNQHNEQNTHPPQEAQPRRFPEQWTRTIRLLAPVRGPTRPGDDLCLFPCTGVRKNDQRHLTSSPRTMDFFSDTDPWRPK